MIGLLIIDFVLNSAISLGRSGMSNSNERRLSQYETLFTFDRLSIAVVPLPLWRRREINQSCIAAALTWRGHGIPWYAIQARAGGGIESALNIIKELDLG